MPFASAWTMAVESAILLVVTATKFGHWLACVLLCLVFVASVLEAGQVRFLGRLNTLLDG
jgi:hypothetical protein